MSVDIVKQRYEIYDKVIDYAKQFRELNKLIEKRPITWKERYKLDCLKSSCAGSYKPKVENEIKKLENELVDYFNMKVLKNIKALIKEYKMLSYQKNKEKERKRYREYYASNSDLEKERVKRIRLST